MWRSRFAESLDNKTDAVQDCDDIDLLVQGRGWLREMNTAADAESPGCQQTMAMTWR